MQLAYGDYLFQANGVRIATRSTMIRERNIPWAYQVNMVVRGELLADGQALLTAASLELEAALRIPYQDLVFYQDDASPSATLMENNDSYSGVQIVRGPDWGGEKGWEYARAREFEFEAEAKFLLPTGGGVTSVISFSERLEFEGGGPQYAMKLAINGPPQRQMVYPQTPYVVVQSGTAVGSRTWPRPPRPKWPGALARAGKTTQDDAEPTGNGWVKFPISWSYHHESVTPLIGSPSLWLS